MNSHDVWKSDSVSKSLLACFSQTNDKQLSEIRSLPSEITEAPFRLNATTSGEHPSTKCNRTSVYKHANAKS